MNVAQYMVVGMIRVYQVTLSPLLRLVSGGAAGCRFEPSCSAYALEAVRRHGAFKGSRLALCRIARCHPWGEAGYDPVPESKTPHREERKCAGAH